MGEIPVDRFGDAGGEVFLGGPAEFGLEFRAVDRVATVVTGAVSDVGDLGGVGFTVGARGFLVEEGADGVNDFDIRFFVQAADVVGLAEAAFLEDEPDRGGVVFDVEPVADLHAVAVDGEMFSLEGVEDDERDKFFGEVIRAVVVRAVRREGREMVGVLERADEVVAGGFRGGVGGVGGEGRFLGEGRIGEREGAVNFVGGDVEETEGGFAGLGEFGPVETGAVEEAERADDVGLDKRLGGIDGAVDVGLGGEIHDGVDVMFGEETGDEGGIADIAVRENVARVVREVGEVGGVAGVSERVEVDEFGQR